MALIKGYVFFLNVHFFQRIKRRLLVLLIWNVEGDFFCRVHILKIKILRGIICNELQIEQLKCLQKFSKKEEERVEVWVKF